LLPSGFTIPDTDPSLIYWMNNASGPVTLILPHAGAAGRKLIAMVKYHLANNTVGASEPGGGPLNSNQLTVITQIGETIQSNVSGPSLAVPRIVELVSDGSGHWLLLAQR
jgi:hypothetical protein